MRGQASLLDFICGDAGTLMLRKAEEFEKLLRGKACSLGDLSTLLVRLYKREDSFLSQELYEINMEFLVRPKEMMNVVIALANLATKRLEIDMMGVYYW